MADNNTGPAGPPNTLGGQSDADIWLQIRRGTEGQSAVPDPEAGILINPSGEWWSVVHQDTLITYGGIALLVILGAIALFYLLRGTIRIDGGVSGRSVPRFSLAQRTAHWMTASLFILLGLTGLIILFGRPVLIPLIGPEAFGVLATAAMQAHNLFGPIFGVAIIVLFLLFVRGNFPSLRDIGWLLRGGGMFGVHASAGRYNFGEKMWFWTAFITGIALTGSGFLLLFPDALGSRTTLQLADLVHAVAALVMIGIGFGHIYLGTLGTEGTFKGMVEGSVDENWARTHHDRWLKEVKAQEGKTS
ncbi:formate dehydrogenase subunit gamma [Dichotomicrobium thermohalophilum]|uniref:Formate dehydrogenase gamma subunit n=1 Tax=Dichotomicrobium thermohalophilum TaxID=933063 RepID=A0A397QBY7_9HYPH|nr:formate dehydrogenase subunit gamma [Dichotomicrobium thermohalophilum]RIA55751.1 formate dehydrogenase gamma subunit [Dichotomicrobium thermohalophilum]